MLKCVKEYLYKINNDKSAARKIFDTVIFNNYFDKIFIFI
jgi:hypothetical protein